MSTSPPPKLSLNSEVSVPHVSETGQTKGKLECSELQVVKDPTTSKTLEKDLEDPPTQFQTEKQSVTPEFLQRIKRAILNAKKSTSKKTTVSIPFTPMLDQASTTIDAHSMPSLEMW